MTEKEFKSTLLPLRNRLYRLAMVLLKKRPEVEDLVQDVYITLWNMRDDLKDYNSIEALAMKITKNRCIDRLRSYRSRYKNGDGLQNVTIQTSNHDPGQILELNETLQQVHRLIAQLPDRQRMALHLREVEQYTYDEMEAITGMSRNNIRVTLSRARKQIRKEYQKKEQL